VDPQDGPGRTKGRLRQAAPCDPAKVWPAWLMQMEAHVGGVTEQRSLVQNPKIADGGCRKGASRAQAIRLPGVDALANEYVNRRL
jgi:hypothetical protein